METAEDDAGVAKVARRTLLCVVYVGKGARGLDFGRPLLDLKACMGTNRRLLIAASALSVLASPVSALGQMSDSTSVRRGEWLAPVAHTTLVGPELTRNVGMRFPGGDLADPTQHLLDTATSRELRRPWWRSPLIGFGVGAAAGGAYGLYLDSTCGGEDNWFCGTYTFSYAVIGGLVGAAVGVVTGARRNSPPP